MTLVLISEDFSRVDRCFSSEVEWDKTITKIVCSSASMAPGVGLEPTSPEGHQLARP